MSRLGIARTVSRIAVAACLLVAMGCSDDSGFHLSGKVTYQGQPVPAGEILLQPDASQGNSGPGAMAIIKDGWFETNAGKGHAGGPHRLTIRGFDGKADMSKMLPHGELLFPDHQLQVDLPHKSSEIDLEIPETTAAEATGL